MNYSMFLTTLKMLIRNGWEAKIHPVSRVIRLMSTNEMYFDYDPLSSVAKGPALEGLNTATAAYIQLAEQIGLSKRLARKIIASSFKLKSGNSKCRRQILEACGLMK